MGTKLILIRPQEEISIRKNTSPTYRLTRKNVYTPPGDAFPLEQTYSQMNMKLCGLQRKDGYTQTHCLNVSRYATAIATIMGMPKNFIEDVKTAGRFHDIGKIAIPENILGKPGKFVPSEREIMEMHPFLGFQDVQHTFPNSPIPTYILTHHVGINNSGYPKNTKWTWGGNVLMAADIYSALTEERPYKEAMSPQKALELIKAMSGKNIHPEIVEAILEASHLGKLELKLSN